MYPGAYLYCSLPADLVGADYVQMPGQERLKDRLAGKFTPSPKRSITHTPGPPGQASSRPVGFKHFFQSFPGRRKLPSPNRPITPTLNAQAMSTPVGPDPTSTHEIPDTQPLNSPSLSNIYPSIVIDPAGDESPGRIADLASAGFQGVKTTLQLVERTADVFPPLKSTVAGLLGVIDIVEVCNFQLSVVTVIVMVLTVPRQPLRTNEISKIWSRS